MSASLARENNVLSADVRRLMEEIIRNLVGVVLLTGFFGVAYLAARRFVGAAGRTMGRRSAALAATSGLIAILLLSVRNLLEPIVAAAVAPLSTLTSSNWPETAAVGVYRTLIATLVMVPI